ncbi:MAG: lamin tail domain-containing protein, partial [Myxococcota bacterium]|nr:lamin tail domain-containing protein [Myxococcota bacterium]
MRPTLLVLLVGCTEYTYSSQTQKDVFQQNSLHTVDVLMVVDNSCSMYEEQDKLAANFEGFIDAFEGIEVDWQIGVVTTDTFQDEYTGRLVGGTDEIELQTASGLTVDAVSWDREWEIQEGVALQLDPDSQSFGGNDSASAWCLATESFGDGDLGNPGEASASCAASGPPAEADTASGEDTGTGGDTASGADTSAGTDTASGTDTSTGADTGTGGDTGAETLATPGAGDVLFTEFLADPGMVADALGEWVELTNVSDEAFDLSGCVLVDGGRNSFELPEGTTLEAGEILVV